MARLRGEEDVAITVSVNSSVPSTRMKVSWNVPRLRSVSPVTVFVKWSRKRLCTIVRATSPLASKKVVQNVSRW